MEAVQVRQVLAKDGEIRITGLPYKRGQAVEVIVFVPPAEPQPRARLTVGQLRRSGLIGLWQDRDETLSQQQQQRRDHQEDQDHQFEGLRADPYYEQPPQPDTHRH